MAASAVTAAMLPKSNDLKQINSADNGTLRSQSGDGNDLNQGVLSCVADNDLVFSCHNSAIDGVTGTGAGSDAFPNIVTVNNTSNSNPNDSVDTTSKA
ncbi:hypothetical protein [Paraflavitalea speifideaquila]|uniref:hypothetical protein n=1 Tax=Paraflavitalea speifideaquila TaxID=3076558 RepID=UPI0028F117A6|nr:hypothetical protein [Paraflavitalea speifideiaquila]